ncbi:condensation domain-containing protein [Kitasatospora sp. NBC_01287]|uniref:condensation domain-containing protein n=1 Tax=Kitasatospora sp. NBC_01287 TaxID=2903573 RepID=UPI00225670CA|nr:condensation domain-containing protein [Kitasatospora sp. NBC_01287]MCX4745034.1 condensation domain-containing protein [Kitasatospora sp. NBC_01287]
MSGSDPGPAVSIDTCERHLNRHRGRTEPVSEADRTPLTFGQLSVLRITARWPTDRWPETYLSVVVPVPAECPLDRVYAGLRSLCERHESLRTHFAETPRGPIQFVRPVEDRVRIATIEDPGADESAAMAIGRGQAAELIDRERDFGRRFTVVTDGGRPRFVVLVCDHIAADGFSLRRLSGELTVLMGGDDPEGRRWLTETPVQPRELALFQRSDANRSSRTAALAHWTRLLDTLDPGVFPVPDHGDQDPGRIEAVLRSPGARSALATAAERLGVPAHGVLLALSSVALAVVSGTARVVLTLQSSNRFRLPWQDLVSSMNQYAPLPLDIGAAPDGFGRYAASVQAAALRSYRFGAYDIDEVTALVRAERGIELGFDNFYNFMAQDIMAAPPYPAASGHASARVEATLPNRQVGPRFDMRVRGGREMPVVIRTDPRVLPEDRLHSLLSWYDQELRRLAVDAEVSTQALYATCESAVARTAS